MALEFDLELCPDPLVLVSVYDIGHSWSCFDAATSFFDLPVYTTAAGWSPRAGYCSSVPPATLIPRHGMFALVTQWFLAWAMLQS